jgi:hypothetical protein
LINRTSVMPPAENFVLLHAMFLTSPIRKHRLHYDCIISPRRPWTKCIA